MSENIELMEKQIDEYFSKITDKQLNNDIKRAGYSFYKNIKVSLPDVPEICFGDIG